MDPGGKNGTMIVFGDTVLPSGSHVVGVRQYQ